MPQKKDGKYGCRMCLHCDEDTAALLERIAISKHTTKSEILRQMLEKGVQAGGFQEDEAQLQARMTASVREVMKPYTERLAAILAKSTQIAGASFFLEVYVLSQLFPDHKQAEIVDAAIRAHLMGVEFSNTKGGGALDAFLQDALFSRG